jgi:tetratricopeptide (TPR) repeat protein
MICPYCETANRDELDTCYHCHKDISMLRLLVNKAKHHYNTALEHAERGRDKEARIELENALDLDGRNTDARVVLGTLLARSEEFDEAREQWRLALAVNPTLEKAHDYVARSEVYRRSLPALRFYRLLALLCVALLGAGVVFYLRTSRPDPTQGLLRTAVMDYEDGQWGQALATLDELAAMPEAGRAQGAKALRRVIERGIRANLDDAIAAVREGDYAGALRRLDSLAARGVGGESGARAGRLRESLPETALADVQALFAAFMETGAGLRRLRQRLSQISEAVEAGMPRPDLQNIPQVIEEAADAREVAEVDLIRAEWFSSGNSEAALMRLHQIMETSGELQTGREFYDSLARRVREDREAALGRLVSRGKYDEARKHEAASLEFFPEALRKRIAAGSAPVVKRIEEHRAGVYWGEVSALAVAGSEGEFILRAEEAGSFPALQKTQARDLATSASCFRRRLARAALDEIAATLRARNHDEVLALAEEARRLELTPGEIEELETMAAEARDVLSRQFIARCSGPLDKAFSWPPGRGVPEDAARRIVEDWEIIEPLIPEEATYRLRQMLFYRAAALAILERDKEAKERLEEFIERYEKSPNRDYARSAKGYLQHVEARLAPKDE